MIESTQSNKESLIIKSLVMFLYVFTFNLSSSISFLTTERVAIVVAFCIIAITHGRIIIETRSVVGNFTKRVYLWELITLGYCFILAIVIGTGTGTTIISDLLNFVIFALLAYVVFTNWFNSVDELMKVFMIISLFQCVVIFGTIINTSFATFIDNLPINNTFNYFDYAYYRAGGYQGGIACITSTGAMQLSLGLISCIYFILKSQKKWGYIFIYLFMTFIMTSVARTGLVLGVAGLVLMFALAIKNHEKKMMRIFGGLIVALLLVYIVANITGLIDMLPTIFKRLLSLKKNGLYDGFFAQYYRDSWGDNGIPALSVKTIFGVLTTSGTSGNGVYVCADGGFVRMYAAIGLPLAIITYAAIFIPMIKIIKKLGRSDLRIVGYLLALFLLIGEYKEPYIIFSRYMLVIASLFLFLAHKEQEEKELELVE